MRSRDALLPAALAAAAEIQLALRDEAGAGELATAPLVVAPLLLRRERPLEAAALACAVYLAAVAAGFTQLTFTIALFVVLLVAVYTLSARSGPRGAVVAWVGVVAVEAAALAIEGDDDGFVVLAALMLAVPAVTGQLVRRERRQAGQLRELAERLNREQEENARLAVHAERTRIARELHDILAHSLSVMVLQADGGRHQVGADPEAERGAFASIEATGREALAESRRLLGVLRDGAPDGALAPQPGLGQLEALIERALTAGLPTELTIEGEPRPLPPGLDLAAYRIVQEALTNGVRHAHGARARVRVAFGADALELEVVDDGRRAGAGAAADPAVLGGERAPAGDEAGRRGGGHGLVGMRERAALYGGAVEAGPADGGGFRVRARLPLEP